MGAGLGTLSNGHQLLDNESMFKGKKVLVVDDEPDLREILRDEFVLGGADVMEAANGLDALKIMEAEDFDLLVSDIRMPGGDGFSLAKAVKAKNPHRPAVVLITGFADVSEQEAKAVGVEAYYQKPFSLELFRQNVQRILSVLDSRQPGSLG